MSKLNELVNRNDLELVLISHIINSCGKVEELYHAKTSYVYVFIALV